MTTLVADEGLQTSGDQASNKCQDAKDHPKPDIESQKLDHSEEKTVEIVEDSAPDTKQEPSISASDIQNSGSEVKGVEKINPQIVEEPAAIPIELPQPPPTATKEVMSDKKKEDDKLIYKALAIKLKKELVKSREELQKLREDSGQERSALNQKVQTLEENLETLQQTSATTIITLESRVKSLKEQLENSELDLQNLQIDFENYKVRASKIMQQNNSSCSASNKTIEENRYKQLRELNDEQAKRITILESQLSDNLSRNQELERTRKLFEEELEMLHERLKSMQTLDNKCEALSRENENLKVALKQFRTKLKEPVAASSSQNCDDYPGSTSASESGEFSRKKHDKDLTQATASNTNLVVDHTLTENQGPQDDNVIRVSPSASVKDDSQTNSSSSYDGSTSGYVHIKPTTFEIISRASVLEDAQNQIDNLTKAYLDSENTNSLLSEQVKALKEEIRRLQRGTERMDLAENLEYLKNVVFKFISLDSGQMEQKQRLVPVLSTVLKLSPDETTKLNSLAMADKPSVASSFFKL